MNQSKYNQSLILKDVVLSNHIEEVNRFLSQGYTPVVTAQDLEPLSKDKSRVVLVKRIFVADLADGKSKRAFTIHARFWDIAASIPDYPMAEPFTQTLIGFGVEYNTTIDPAGVDQMEVGFAQNGDRINVQEAEDRFLKVFNGMGQPFVN